jgi:GGDEF domain-containing protein
MLSASVGVAYAPAGEITAEELLKRADRAMRRSKDEGHGLPVLEKT